MFQEEKTGTAQERLADLLFFVLAAVCAFSAYGWYLIVLYLTGVRTFHGA